MEPRYHDAGARGDGRAVRDLWRVVWSVVLVAAVFAWIRARLWLDDVPNPDIAGILYEADRLREGALPYVDVVEVKPPGTFFVVALSFGIFGRSLDVVQAVHAACMVAAAVATAVAARALAAGEGARRDLAALVAGAVFVFYAPQFSWNYASWMTCAWALAVAALAVGMRTRVAWPWFAAGAFGTFAVLCKQSAATVVLPAAWALVGTNAPRPRCILSAAAGVLAGLSPVAAPYAVRGEIGALLAGIAPVSLARAYVGSASAPADWPLRAAAQLVETFPSVVAVLAAAALSPWIAGRRFGAPAGAGFALSVAVAGIAGAAMGGARFYLHYLVQYVPGLALLVASGPCLRGVARLVETARDRAGAFARRAAAGLVLAFAALAVAGEFAAVLFLGRHHHEALPRRLGDGRTAAQAAGSHIAARTGPADTVQAWGWTAWPVYFWADRRAPTPVYKPMGVLTTFNTNSAFDVGTGPEVRTGPLLDAFVDAFERAPPAYFVYSPSMVRAFGAPVDPLLRIDRLARVLSERYVTEAVFGDLVLLRLRSAGAPAGASGGAPSW